MVFPSRFMCHSIHIANNSKVKREPVLTLGLAASRRKYNEQVLSDDIKVKQVVADKTEKDIDEVRMLTGGGFGTTETSQGYLDSWRN